MPRTAEATERSNIVSLGSLEGVAPEAVLAVWPKIGPMLADAINRDTGAFGLQDVFHRVINKHMQLWVYLNNGVKACCITQIENRSSGRVCVVYYAAGGYMNEWKHFDEGLGNWAKSHGCVALEALGRPGWERVLKGWNKVAIVMRKEL